MKKLFTRIVSVFIPSLMLLSCSNNNNVGNPVTPQNTVLTQDLKAKLQFAADSIFMQVSAPGMIAMVSAEGERDYIIKRGVSNLSTNVPMNENNYYRIASITKTFTGLAVLLLVDEGLIKLDSSISYYLPEFNIPNGNLITIRMLGNMTSGLFDYSADEGFLISFYESNYLMSFTPDSLLAIAFRHPPNFPPGTSYEYCNTNTVLLGMLLEKVTGKTAKQVIEQKVLQPLNLSNTYWPNTIFLPVPYSHGYSSRFGSFMDATNWNPSCTYSAGILISNFSDMKIWAKAVADGTLLSAQMKTERFKWVLNHYGFCVMKAGNWVGHPGTFFGYNSHVFYNTVNKITLIVFVNMETDLPVEAFSDAFRRILD